MHNLRPKHFVNATYRGDTWTSGALPVMFSITIEVLVTISMM